MSEVLIPSIITPGLRVAADVAMQTSKLVAKDTDLPPDARDAVAAALANFATALLKVIDLTEDDAIAVLMRPKNSPTPERPAHDD